MKKFRYFMALASCGIIIGVGFSVFSAAPASARLMARCDQKIETMEKQAAKAYAKGKMSQADYDKTMAEIAYHRQLWGC